MRTPDLAAQDLAPATWASAVDAVRAGGRDRWRRRRSAPPPRTSLDTGRRRHSRSGRAVGLHAARMGVRRLAAACATKSRGEERPRHRHPGEPRGHAGGQLRRRRGIGRCGKGLLLALRWRAARVAPRGGATRGQLCATCAGSCQNITDFLDLLLNVRLMFSCNSFEFLSLGIENTANLIDGEKQVISLNEVYCVPFIKRVVQRMGCVK